MRIQSRRWTSIAPIVVRKEGNTYQIIAGERRWRAWHDVGSKEIPAIVREANDLDARELSLIENWQREDLSEPEKERFVYQLYKDGKKADKYKNESDMARRTGLNQTTLQRVILAGEEKEAANAPPETKQVSAKDLSETRAFRKASPEAGRELLKIRSEKPEKLPQNLLRGVISAVEKAPKDKQKKVVELIAGDKLQLDEMRAC